MRKLVAWVFMYSLDGLLADEGTEDWQFCFGLPVDPADQKQKLGVYESAYIVVWGGVGLWRSLMRLDLIDEFPLDLHPYVAGEGTRLFDDVPKSYRLDLVSSTAFSKRDRRVAVPQAPLVAQSAQRVQIAGWMMHFGTRRPSRAASRERTISTTIRAPDLRSGRARSLGVPESGPERR